MGTHLNFKYLNDIVGHVPHFKCARKLKRCGRYASGYSELQMYHLTDLVKLKHKFYSLIVDLVYNLVGQLNVS